MKDLRLQISRWITNNLGDNFWGEGNNCPPGTAQKLIFGEPDDDGIPMHIATTYNNDGFELWIGYRKGAWELFFKAEHARRLAWFILWDWWAKGTWFGLKRKIWYWGLHNIVESYKKYKPTR